jgi:hypothetical protein
MICKCPCCGSEARWLNYYFYWPDERTHWFCYCCECIFETDEGFFDPGWWINSIENARVTEAVRLKLHD